MQELPENFDLKSFINESKNRLNAILHQLQWSEEYVLQSPERSANKKPKFEDEEPELPQSCTTTNSITLDVNELRNLVEDQNVEVPQKFSDLQVNFTRAQKLRIYEHIVSRTGKCTEPEIANNCTFSEIVATKKREKKHKRRHRVSKPTHIEEVRALVELQMQSLQQYMAEQHERERERRKAASNVPRHRSRSRERRKHHKHRSTSREHKSQRRHHKSRSKSRERKHKSRSKSRERKHKRRRSRNRSRERAQLSILF